MIETKLDDFDKHESGSISEKVQYRRNWRSLANMSLEGKCDTAVYNCLPLADKGQESTN